MAVFRDGQTKEAGMHLKEHKILKALALGFAIAAVAAPTALAEPRGLGNIDPLIADAIRAHQAETPASPDDRPFYRGVSSGAIDVGAIDPLIADAIRADQAQSRKVSSGAIDVGALDPLIADAIRADQAQSRSSDDRSVAGSAAEQPSVQTRSANDGFEWIDAGVGAGSTLLLVLLGGGTTALVYRQRRRPSAL